MLSTLSKAVQELNTTNSILSKKKILKKYDEIKEIFKYTYDKSINFNVTSKAIHKYDKDDVIENNEELFKLLDNLADGVITGHNAIRSVKGYLMTLSDEHSDLVLKIIDKDLKIRMNVKQINDVFPNLIQTFEVALAHPIEKYMKHFNKGGEWFIMRKLDGVRCLCIIDIDKKRVLFFSRENKPFQTLSKIEEVVRKTIMNKLKTSMVLDGEVCLMKDGLESFSGLMKELKMKDHTIKDPKYRVFDAIPLDDFRNKYSEKKYDKRHKDAQKLVSKCKSDTLECIEKFEYTEEKMSEMMDVVQKEKWEGLMLRKNVPYEGKRTNDLLKVKSFQREEYKVIDIETSPISNNGGEFAGKMGLKNVIIHHKDNEVRIGSGFTCEERIYYYENPDEIVGKIISVQYFEETMVTDKNKNITYSLRFPTFKGVYGEAREF